MSHQRSKPRIALFATGGTIASAAGSQAQLRDYKITNRIEAMLEAVPLIADLAEVQAEQVCNIESHKIGDQELLLLAAKVRQATEREDIDGVVITHGTDTLEETAYFLHLAIPTEKPIVLVGAMRPSTALSADGPLNLFHAVSVAINPASSGHGALIVMNDRIASARHATKGHANAVEAFVPTEFGYLGLVSGAEVRYENRILTRHTASSELVLSEHKPILPAVDIIYDYQGAGVHHFKASIDAGAQAIVLAATGQGSLSPQGLKGVELAKAAGVTVIRASRVWQGAVRPVARDNQWGLVAAQTLNPPRARVLARLALLRTQDQVTLQRLFDTH